MQRKITFVKVHKSVKKERKSITEMTEKLWMIWRKFRYNYNIKSDNYKEMEVTK